MLSLFFFRPAEKLFRETAKTAESRGQMFSISISISINDILEPLPQVTSVALASARKLRMLRS